MSGGITPGPWAYRPVEHDDWGVVRAPADGEGRRAIICQARDPEVWSEDQLNEHRRAGTDPWEANARAISAMPELLAAAERIERLYGMDVPAFDALRAAIAKARGQ